MERETPYQKQLEGKISIMKRSLDAVDHDQIEEHQRLQDLKDQLMLAEQRENHQRDKAEKLLAGSGIGKRFLSATFENFERDRMPKAYDMALGYVDAFRDNDGEGLLFTGDVGTGKTHLAAAVAVEIIRRYSSTVEFVSYVEVLADIRAAFSNHSYEAVRLEESMREAKLLVIDDLGKEKPSPFTNEFLYRVINGRYKDKRPIIITSNLGIEELSERIDYTVFSRIVDICKTNYVKSSGF